MKKKNRRQLWIIGAVLVLLCPALLGAGPAPDSAADPPEIRMDKQGITGEEKRASEPETAQKVQQEPAELTWESPVFFDNEDDCQPQKELERDGKQFRLISKRIRTVSLPGERTYLSADIPYELEGRQEPPESAVLTATDENTGLEYEREVPRLEIVEKEISWSDDFSFPVTISGYDADSFLLGDTEIPKDAPLSDYGEEFLDFLGLPGDCYRIHTVIWSGEAYEKEGILCRDALAAGEKLVRSVEVKYGGEVLTPDIQGKQYIGIYEEILPEPEEGEGEEQPEKMPAESVRTASAAAAKSLGIGERIVHWLTKHLTVVTISLSFAAVFLAVLFLQLVVWRRLPSGKNSL